MADRTEGCLLTAVQEGLWRLAVASKSSVSPQKIDWFNYLHFAARLLNKSHTYLKQRLFDRLAELVRMLHHVTMSYC